MRYEFTLGKNALIVPALILPGVVMTAVLVLLLEYVLPLADWGDWGILGISVGFFLVVAFLTLRLVALTTSRVEVTEAEGGIAFRFLEKKLFNRRSFRLAFSDILNVGEDTDKGYDFLYFTTNQPGYRKFHLTARESDRDFEAFRNYVTDKVASYNSTVATQQRITDKTMFQKWPMMTLAVLLVVFWFAYPVASALLGAPWLNDLKYWALVAMSMPIVTKVYFQRLKQ